MTSFSFTLTPQLRSSLEALDAVRIKILTTPLSPKLELKFKWESTIDRIYYSLLLSDVNTSRKEVESILSASAFLRKPKKLEQSEKLIIKYKKAIDIISHNWFATDKALTPKTVISLHEVAATGSYKGSEQDLRQILDYLQTGADHPVVHN